MRERIVLRGGCVLTLDPKVGNFAKADVLIEEGRIVEVGDGLRARDAEAVDATDSIVMPGFVDTHRHVWESLFRHLGGPGFGGEAPGVYGPHHQPEDVYAATLIGLLGAIEAGITTVVDWSDIQLDGAYAEAALQAHAEAGLRTVLAPSVPSWAGKAAAESALRGFLAGHTGKSGPSPTTIARASSPPARSDLDRLAAEWALARELGLRIHTHAGTDPAERGVVSELGRRGLLGEDVTLVHCSHLDAAEFDAIAASRTSVSLTPASEMAGGLGSPPIQDLIDRGIRPGLGVDSEHAAPGDMFAQMRAAISLQHAKLFDLKLAGKAAVPRLLSTREVIRYATVDGARVAGLGGVTGSLTPGKQADLVVLRADRPNIVPVNDPIGAVVWGMDTSNVDWVFVGGRALIRKGVLEADVGRARDLAMAAQRRVAAAAGALAAAGAGRSR